MCTWHTELGRNPELISRTAFLATDNEKPRLALFCKQDLCCRGHRMVAKQKRYLRISEERLDLRLLLPLL